MVSIRIHILRFFTGTLLGVLAFSCAKVGVPSGGPGDTTPPVIISSKPANYKTNFRGERLEITFDEFVVLKGLSDQLIVSPPLENRPVARIRGKTCILNINNPLRDSITYTFNFGDAITDFHEGNPLTNFEFVVSTGDYLDTLTVTGRVLQAEDLKPGKDPVLVMLYDNLNDSAPLLEIPLYAGKTDKDGNYAINNIKTGTYKIFGLRDVNRNMKYDLPDEAIAFVDSVFVFDPAVTEFNKDVIVDTSLIGAYVDSTMFTDSLTTEFVVDSISGDTIDIPRRINYALHVNLSLFNEQTTIQYVTVKERPERGRLLIDFNRPPFDSISIEPLSFNDRPNLLLKEVSRAGDSIVMWINDTSIIRMDTMLFKITYSAFDSLHHLISVSDTINFRYREKKEKPLPGRRQRKEEEELRPVTYIMLKSTVVPNGYMDLNRNLGLVAERPVDSFVADSMRLYRVADSVETAVPFTLIPDSGRLRTYMFNVKWEEDTRYHLFVAPGAFTDIYGLSNDTTDISFTTRDMTYYGKVIVKTGDNELPYIIQLLNSKGIPVRIKPVVKGEDTVFDFLNPGSYSLKAILDLNHNGKWDTGDYLKKIQPEKIFLNPGTIDLRSNWDMEVTWNIQ